MALYVRERIVRKSRTCLFLKTRLDASQRMPLDLPVTTMDEDVFQTKLSLEPPYKNDVGDPIPVTYEILPHGEYIYEPCVQCSIGVQGLSSCISA